MEIMGKEELIWKRGTQIFNEVKAVEHSIKPLQEVGGVRYISEKQFHEYLRSKVFELTRRFVDDGKAHLGWTRIEIYVVEQILSEVFPEYYEKEV